MTDEELLQLLPWYVNGTLSADEQADVAALLERSEPARQELLVLQRLQQQLKSEASVPASELGWRRLQRDIRAESSSQKPAGINWWKSGVAAAATVVIALQVGLLTQSVPPSNDTRLLSQGTIDLTLPHWLIQVEFKQGGEWQTVVDVVRAVDGRIVDGPSSLGLLRIAIPEDHSKFADAEAAVAWLLQQDQVAHAALEVE